MSTKKSKSADNKSEDKLAGQVLDLFVKTQFAAGNLTSEDLSSPDLGKKILSLVNLMKDDEFKLILDHRTSIIEQAAIHLKNKDYNYAKMYYATFFEHSLNNIIDHRCFTLKMDAKTSVEAIRNINLVSKLTWFPKILGLPAFNKKHVSTIITLADQRNAFVHYKWVSNPNDELDQDEEDKIEVPFFKKVKSAISYIKKYESLLKYKKSKSKLRTYRKHLKPA